MDLLPQKAYESSCNIFTVFTKYPVGWIRIPSEVIDN